MIHHDAHHLCHDRASWEARPEGYSIREKLIARRMDRAVHEECHRETGPVPVPLFHSLQWVANRFTDQLDPLIGIDTLCSLLESANRLKYAKPIEREVNLLAIDALQAQVPYIQDGIIKNNIIDLGAYHGART